MARTFFECCIDCKNRSAECHAKCQKYINDKKERDIYLEEVKKNKEKEKQITDYKRIKYIRTKKT